MAQQLRILASLLEVLSSIFQQPQCSLQLSVMWSDGFFLHVGVHVGRTFIQNLDKQTNKESCTELGSWQSCVITVCLIKIFCWLKYVSKLSFLMTPHKKAWLNSYVGTASIEPLNYFPTSWGLSVRSSHFPLFPITPLYNCCAMVFLLVSLVFPEDNRNNIQLWINLRNV